MDGDRGPFQQFPMMVLRERFERSKPPIERRVATRLARWIRDVMADPKPSAPPYNLRQAVLDSLERLTQESLGVKVRGPQFRACPPFVGCPLD